MNILKLNKSGKRLQYVLNMHSADITALLKKLCAENYLESDNNGRWTTYRIKQKVDTSNVKVDTSQKVDTSFESADNTAKTDEKVDTLDRKVDTSDRKGDTLKKSATRMNRKELETQIMTICKQDFVKMEAVAQSIGKSVDYLKNKIFPVMMKDRKLVKRFPYTHNHPEQGYKTNDDYAEGL